MTNNKKCTRYYSSRQEKRIAKAVRGKTVSNSGAITFGAGDVITQDGWLFEAKTKTEESKSFSIKREWIEKNKEEAFAMGKDYNALVIDFGDGKQFYLLDEKTFLEMKRCLEACNDTQNED